MGARLASGFAPHTDIFIQIKVLYLFISNLKLPSLSKKCNTQKKAKKKKNTTQTATDRPKHKCAGTVLAQRHRRACIVPQHWALCVCCVVLKSNPVYVVFYAKNLPIEFEHAIPTQTKHVSYFICVWTVVRCCYDRSYKGRLG